MGASFRKQDLGAAAVTQDLNDVEVLGSGDYKRIGGDEGVLLFEDLGTWTTPKSQTTEIIYKLAFPVDKDHGMAVGQQFLIGAYH